MRLVLLTIAALSAVFADDWEVDEGVIVGTNDNFAKVIEKYDFVLVEFYAPWCGHCKSLAPEYAKAATALADNDKVALMKVDATVESDLGSKFGVRGYPTLKWFKGHNAETPLDYGGDRKADGIVSWIEKKTGPAFVALDSADGIKEFKDNSDVVVIGYFAEGSDTASFISVADGFDDIPFGIVSDADLAKDLDLAEGGITLFKQFDEGFNKFEGEDLKEFVNENRLAYVTEFSDKTAPKIFGGEIKKHILMFAARSASEFDTHHSDFTAAAKGFRGKVLFVFIDCDKSDNGRILEFFGLKEEDCPSARMIEMGKSMQKFKPESDSLAQADVESFVSGVLDGSIKRHLMSEDVPEDNSGPVTLIVGKNFDDIAYDSEKDVLIEFYAPWCGHCKQLAPVWDKLGEHFADRDDIVIAKSDATLNEFADIEVSGFPTLKFFPKGDKKVVDYSGGRDLDSLVKFMETSGNPDAAGDDEEADDDEEDIEEEEDEEAEDAPEVKDEL